MFYLSIKALHILAIISWMAGILYLYRLLINLVENLSKGAIVTDVLTGMAMRLYKLITMPALGVTYLAGFAMIAMQPEIMRVGSMHAKLLLVLFLTVSTVYAGRLTKAAARGEFKLPSSRNLRILNEVPTVLMILIVVLIIVRPF